MYIVISGNAGAGKSTLGNYLNEYLRPKVPIEYVDEKLLHHELIQKMFDRPKEYAFLIQINFLLQRSLKVKSLTEDNRIFIMERSLDEDFLFAYGHYQRKNIDSKDFEIYRELWEDCLSKIPSPSLYIYLHSNDTVLLTQRVIQGHKQRQRKQELPDEALQEYIREMNVLYNDWFENLHKPKLKVPIFTTTFKNHKNFTKITESILSLVNLAKVKY